MRLVLFYHSLVSDWNHGNAHFLRGIASELLARGHEIRIYEPANGWSLRQLLADAGLEALTAFRRAFPLLRSASYEAASFDVEAALDDADLVIVHEWTEPWLIRRIGAARAAGGRFRLLFHDTHHRLVSAPAEIGGLDLGDYDGVLAFGEVLRARYLGEGLAARAWTWHEAADVRVFGPRPGIPRRTDLAWVGNWGDGERSAELREFLLEPVRSLNLRAEVHGVRYPPEAVRELQAAGIAWRGWVPNFEVPRIFAGALFTVHVPRRFYREQLPGIPTIRVFEALACGIPLVTAPWEDVEGLFTPGRDYLVARNGTQMREQLRRLRWDPACAQAIADQGRRTVLARHTCAHRVDELLQIAREIGVGASHAQAAGTVPAPAQEALRQA